MSSLHVHCVCPKWISTKTKQKLGLYWFRDLRHERVNFKFTVFVPNEYKQQSKNFRRPKRYYLRVTWQKQAWCNFTSPPSQVEKGYKPRRKKSILYHSHIILSLLASKSLHYSAELLQFNYKFKYNLWRTASCSFSSIWSVVSLVKILSPF